MNRRTDAMQGRSLCFILPPSSFCLHPSAFDSRPIGEMDDHATLLRLSSGFEPRVGRGETRSVVPVVKRKSFDASNVEFRVRILAGAVEEMRNAECGMRNEGRPVGEVASRAPCNGESLVRFQSRAWPP